MDLEFLSAVVSRRQDRTGHDRTAALGDSRFNYQLVFDQPGLTNEMITGANISAGGLGKEGAVSTLIKKD